MKNNFIAIIIGVSLIMSCQNHSLEKNAGKKPVVLSDSLKRANCVYLTSDEKSLPVISWCETDIKSNKKDFYMAFFDEGSQQFSSRISIPIEQNASFHEEGMPKIAIKGNGTIIAVYETSAPTDSNQYAGFVHYIVSPDKGRTWTHPACVHADTASGKSHSFAVITKLSNGEIGACWLDESIGRKNRGRPVKFAATNSKNEFINELLIDSVACQCCRIAMSSNSSGKISVAFRDILNDSIRDMSISTSYDNGSTFTPAVSFSKDGWVINGCPHNGPAVVTSDNNIYATWFTGGRQKGIYYCEMNDKRKLITKQLISDHGRFIQLCLMPDGDRILAFNETVKEENNIYSKIVLNKIGQDKTFTSDISANKSMANYPVIKSFGKNNIVVAWTDNERIYYAVTNTSDINRPIVPIPVNNNVFEENNLSGIKLAVSRDLVCGMPLSMSPADTAFYKGKVYGFCSEVCKKEFLRHPESLATK